MDNLNGGYRHKVGDLPFFRYSKFCCLEWFAALALIIYGFIELGTFTGKILLLVGITLFVLGPLLNEIFITIYSSCC